MFATIKFGVLRVGMIADQSDALVEQFKTVAAVLLFKVVCVIELLIEGAKRTDF